MISDSYEERIVTVATKERDRIKAGLINQKDLMERYNLSRHMAGIIFYSVKIGSFDGEQATERDLGVVNKNVANDRIIDNGVGNVLVIGDTHIPFVHPDYLDFCLWAKDHYECEHVVHIGDEVDNHAISYHESDPDGLSAGMEAEACLEELRAWYKAFPEVTVIVGNHGALPFRKAFTAGLPRRFLKTYREIWEAPDGWTWTHEAILDNVVYQHGIGTSGKNAALNKAMANRQSTVIGHVHSWGGVQYTSGPNDTIFGMNVGCGIDENAYAMAYSKPFRYRPTLGCGVVLGGGLHAIFLPMF